MWLFANDESYSPRGAPPGENGVFRDVMVSSNGINRSKKFYDALFVAIVAGKSRERETEVR